MLFIAFENDHIIPPKVARHNAEKYKAKPVEFKEFSGRPLPGGTGLGGGRRLRPGLGCSERDGTADGVGRPASGRDVSAV